MTTWDDYLNAKDPETGETFKDFALRRNFSFASIVRGYEVGEAIQRRLAEKTDPAATDTPQSPIPRPPQFEL